ncbi:MAG: hypothetical protein ACR2NW_00680 [Thermodesulfobacteriota bacterium]
MGNSLIYLSTFLTSISLLFIATILYFQLREFRLLRRQNEILSVRQEEEPLPILNFYNGKVHNNGMLSVKVKNTGKRINGIKFISENNKVDIRCGNESVNKEEDLTVSFVPEGFNFSESYFETRDLIFSINYKSILNDSKKENFKMENPQTIFKIETA